VRPGPAAGVSLLFAAGLAAQAALQEPLGHANELRSVRRTHRAPNWLGFSLAAGGVKEAAADALWLDTLPTLGKTWDDPARKGEWIRGVVKAIQRASPRWPTPVIYGGYFLEFIDKLHPAIDEIYLRAMDAEVRGVRVNDGCWEFPYVYGMHFLLWNKVYLARTGVDRRKDALRWLAVMARMPECPPGYREAAENMIRREARQTGGSELEAWELYRVSWREQVRKTKQAGRDPLEGWGGFIRRGYDEARLRLLAGWAEKAEARLGRWPRDAGEVLAEAGAADRERFRGGAGGKDRPMIEDFLEGVEVHPERREVEVPALTALLLADAQEGVRNLVRRYEAKNGRPPAGVADLAEILGRPLPPPPRNGTKWEISRPGGEVRVVPDPEDPRLRR